MFLKKEDQLKQLIPGIKTGFSKPKPKKNRKLPKMYKTKIKLTDKPK